MVELIQNLHNKLKINHGLFSEEYPEQLMSCTFLTGNETVLEIGGNIGRNSLIIASIIKPNKLVVLECNKDTCILLEENKNINNLEFYIEPSALSPESLVLNGWDSHPLSIRQDGILINNIISYNELCDKYKLQFDTLILDCEGAFYYILQNFPNILDNINLIIMENDYKDLSHYIYVKSKLINSGFITVYKLSGGWGVCYDHFFEVYKKH